MTSPVLTVTTPRARLGAGARIGIGFVLLLPAFLALSWSYLLPTGRAVMRSTTRDDLARPPIHVGADNYRRFDQTVLEGYGLALLLALIPFVLALLVAPLLAVLADQAGRRARLATRALLAVPVAGYAPVALLIGWRLDRTEPTAAAAAAHSYALLVELTTVGSAGLVVAVATTAFLATLRGRRRPIEALPAAATVAVLLLIGVIATTLQSFVAPMLVGGTRGTLPLGNILVALRRMDLGRGSAEAVLLLAVLAALGLAATALLLASRIRIELADHSGVPAPNAVAGAGPDQTPVEGNRGARIWLAVAGAIFVAVLLWVAWPWLRRSLRFTSEVAPLPTAGLADLLVWTWLPTLLSTLVTIGVAVAGAFAIGGLRPLGRFSELLLLPFAPWLFVGTGPLAIESFLQTRDLGQLDTFLGIMPPGWVNIPALFLFTLLFRGLAPRWRAGGTFGRTMLAPAVPMVILAALVSWLVSAGQVLWPWLASQTPSTLTAPLNAMGQFGRIPADELALGAVLPLPIMVLFLVALVVLQVIYLDRLAIRVGRPQPSMR